MPEEFKQKAVFATDMVVKEPESESDGIGTVTGVIVSDAVDRDGEVIIPKGVNLGEFRKNPVVLFGHDRHSPPIGKAEWIKFKKNINSIVAKVIFADTDMGKEIFNLFKGGFMKAFSVGFNPFSKGCDFGRPTDDEIKERSDLKNVSTIFRKIDMVEFSAVPIPANPEALAFAVGKGLKISDRLAEEFGIDTDWEPESSGGCPDASDPIVVTPHKKIRVVAKKSPIKILSGPVNRDAIVEKSKKELELAIARKTGRVIFTPSTNQE